jgi:hypothetical protein
MNWEQLQPWFAEESLALHCKPYALAEALRIGPKAVIEWGLQTEWQYEEQTALAVLHRAENGHWPEMVLEVQFLVAHRLMAAGCQVELLGALRAPSADRETALMLLCVRNWNLLRYVSWLVFAGRQASGPVYDPFDPPAWAQ